MKDGFDYFDGNHRENFCAALILLCLDEDSSFNCRLAKRIRKLFDLPDSERLNGWGREVSLETDQGKRRRSDLWLQFGEKRYLIEIKTHSGWDAEDVVTQVLAQRASQIGGQRIRDAALLAPSSFLQCIRSVEVRRNVEIRKLHWREVLDLVDEIEKPSRLLCLAQAQWRSNVEAQFGLSIPTPVSSESMQRLVSQTGCLAAFLRSTLERLGGDTRDGSLYLSGPNDQPRRQGKWAWFALSIPGQLKPHGGVVLGIYTYVDCPEGDESYRGMQLEIYRKGEDTPFLHMPFKPQDLTHDGLAEVSNTFLTMFNDLPPA